MNRQIVFVVFLLFFHTLLLANPNLEKTFMEESIRQGTILWNKSQEYCFDRLWQNCIESIRTFLYIYPFHPAQLQARDLLSQTFQKLGMIRESIEIDKNTYLENPTREEAQRALLRAGRNYVRIGDYDMAKKIFHDLREASFYSEIAREADLELRQWSVLSGNTRQIQENF